MGHPTPHVILAIRNQRFGDLWKHMVITHTSYLWKHGRSMKIHHFLTSRLLPENKFLIKGKSMES